MIICPWGLTRSCWKNEAFSLLLLHWCHLCNDCLPWSPKLQFCISKFKVCYSSSDTWNILGHYQWALSISLPVTTQQRLSESWMLQYASQVTASIAHRVAHRTPAGMTNLLNDIMQYTPPVKKLVYSTHYRTNALFSPVIHTRLVLISGIHNIAIPWKHLHSTVITPTRGQDTSTSPWRKLASTFQKRIRIWVPLLIA